MGACTDRTGTFEIGRVVARTLEVPSAYPVPMIRLAAALLAAGAGAGVTSIDMELRTNVEGESFADLAAVFV